MDIYEAIILSYIYDQKEISLDILSLEQSVNKEELQKVASKLCEGYDEIINLEQDQIKILKKLENRIYLSNKNDYNKIKNRIAYIFFQLIIATDYISIDNLAEQLNVSRSTINNDLKRIRKRVMHYNSEVLGRPNKGLYLKTTEFQRHLIFFHEVNSYLEWIMPLHRDIVDNLTHIIDDTSLPELVKRNMITTVSFMIYRKEKNNSINQDFPIYDNIDLAMSSHLAQIINGVYNINLNQIEVNVIFFPMISLNTSFAKMRINKENKWLLEKIIDETTEQIKKKYAIYLNKYKLFERIKDHLAYLINRLLFKIPHQNNINIKLENEYPLAYEFAKETAYIIEKELNVISTEQDISYLHLYFIFALKEKDQKIQEISTTVNKIAVVTNQGKGVFKFIKQHILNNTSLDGIEIIHLKKHEIEKLNTNNFEIIFTTEDLDNKLTNVIHIEEMTDFIEQVSYHMRLLSNQEKNIIGQDLDISFCSVSFSEEFTYEEKVLVALREIEDDPTLINKLFNIFKEKESENSMVYENNIYFPHITNPSGDNIKIVVSNEVDQLFVFLSIPAKMTDSQEYLLTKIYDKIFSLIATQELKSIDTTSFEKFMNYGDDR